MLHPNPFLGELIGTMVLILLGNGVVANVILQRSKAAQAGWMVITTGWAFAVCIAVFVAQHFGSSAAHLNPAVTLALAIRDQQFDQVLPFCTAQLLGAMVGAKLVWLHYWPHWALTTDQGDKLACFATAPAVRHPWANLFSELLGTLVLTVGVGSLYAAEKSGLAPFLVGVLVWSIGLSLGGTTGYAINPARDLGPRLVHTLLPIPGKGSSDWAYSWVPVVGPLLGGALGGWILSQL